MRLKVDLIFPNNAKKKREITLIKIKLCKCGHLFADFECPW